MGWRKRKNWHHFIWERSTQFRDRHRQTDRKRHKEQGRWKRNHHKWWKSVKNRFFYQNKKGNKQTNTQREWWIGLMMPKRMRMFIFLLRLFVCLCYVCHSSFLFFSSSSSFSSILKISNFSFHIEQTAYILNEGVSKQRKTYTHKECECIDTSFTKHSMSYACCLSCQWHKQPSTFSLTSWWTWQHLALSST